MFDFSLYKRNKHLMEMGFEAPKTTKTGTTIAGIVFKDGVVLGADTRATEGPIVADKNCEKIHYISENIYCCGAGTAADTEMTTLKISSQLELHKLHSGRQPKVGTALTLLKQLLFQHQGHIGAALVLGGYDYTGAHLYTVAPHGSTDKLPYVTMGSGSLAAMAIFERFFKPNMEKDEAVKLVVEAIKAGIFNDLGSGSNVDITIITKDGVEVLRNHEKPNERGVKEKKYLFQRGSTAILTEKIRKFEVVEEQVSPRTAEPMDLS